MPKTVISVLIALLLPTRSTMPTTPPYQQKPIVILAPAGFGPELSGWDRQGDAQFAADPGVAHDSRSAVRITVPANAELRYQQVRHDILTDIRPGDEYRASAWVRSPGAADGSGAYLALEFLGSQGERTGIAHSRVSIENGSKGWEQLAASGTAPDNTRGIRLSLILNSHGTAWFADPEIFRTGRPEPWPDLGDSLRKVTIHAGDVTSTHFGGVGFHAFQHSFAATQRDMDEVIYKRWRELNPSFVRVNHEIKWDHAKLDQVSEHMKRMKETGTSFYVTTWDPEDAKTLQELEAYARKVVDSLEYLYRTKGLTSIRWYCMTNELSLKGWGKLTNDLPRFRDYHRAILAELKRRNLPIGLLATDASPIDYWWTLDWAAKNMDDVTAVYGGHHYVNDHPLGDERFYPWFLDKVQGAADLARSKGKEFILGEFGAKQDGRTIDGVLHDCCVYFDTPQEPSAAIQICEAAIAAINGGAYAMGYWTYMDLPDDFAKGYINKWGLFRCSGNDRSTRAPYYAYGLLTKFFRGPAKVYRVESGDPRLRIGAIQQDSGGWSIAVINRNKRAVPLDLRIDMPADRPLTMAFRKYVYDPVRVPQNPWGDLQEPSRKVRMKSGHLADSVDAGTLTVYTTAFHESRPAAVQGLKVVRGADGADHLTWQPNRESDLCYYRVFRSAERGFRPSPATRIGSTVANHFEAGPAPGQWQYRVIAVDQSGNASPSQ